MFLHMDILWTKTSFFFKNSSPSARGLHLTSVTQNRKNRAEFSIIFAFHCQLDAAIDYCHNMIVHENDLCLVNLIEMEGEENKKLIADHRYPWQLHLQLNPWKLLSNDHDASVLPTVGHLILRIETREFQFLLVSSSLLQVGEWMSSLTQNTWAVWLSTADQNFQAHID